jgi:predicted component of type VI protein secretion system
MIMRGQEKGRQKKTKADRTWPQLLSQLMHQTDQQICPGQTAAALHASTAKRLESDRRLLQKKIDEALIGINTRILAADGW